MLLNYTIKISKASCLKGVGRNLYKKVTGMVFYGVIRIFVGLDM